MHETQLHTDIFRRTRDKFKTWLLDSAELYKIAGLTYEDYNIDISYLTLMCAISILVEQGLTEESIHDGVDIAIRSARKGLAELRHKSR